jgi:hypothetical protein
MFQSFGRKYYLLLQGDNLFQVDSEVAGKKGCVGYMVTLEEVLAKYTSH